MEKVILETMLSESEGRERVARKVIEDLRKQVRNLKKEVKVILTPYNKIKNEEMKETIKEESSTSKKIKEILSAMTDLLLYKNKKYGDSALKPNNIFYKGDATNSILIRLDDKIGRIKNNPEIAVNDVCDIIGYCTLLLASKNISRDDIERLKD